MDEKFPNEEVEKLKGLARVEETFPDADACTTCADKRRNSGDPTDLCAEHLKRVLGASEHGWGSERSERGTHPRAGRSKGRRR